MFVAECCAACLPAWLCDLLFGTLWRWSSLCVCCSIWDDGALSWRGSQLMVSYTGIPFGRLWRPSCSSPSRSSGTCSAMLLCRGCLVFGMGNSLRRSSAFWSFVDRKFVIVLMLVNTVQRTGRGVTLRPRAISVSASLARTALPSLLSFCSLAGCRCGSA